MSWPCAFSDGATVRGSGDVESADGATVRGSGHVVLAVPLWVGPGGGARALSVAGPAVRVVAAVEHGAPAVAGPGGVRLLRGADLVLGIDAVLAGGGGVTALPGSRVVVDAHAAAPGQWWRCTGAASCGHNGRCNATDGACRCDPPWQGHDCGALAFAGPGAWVFEYAAGGGDTCAGGNSGELCTSPAGWGDAAACRTYGCCWDGGAACPNDGARRACSPDFADAPANVSAAGCRLLGCCWAPSAGKCSAQSPTAGACTADNPSTAAGCAASGCCWADIGVADRCEVPDAHGWAPFIYQCSPGGVAVDGEEACGRADCCWRDLGPRTCGGFRANKDGCCWDARYNWCFRPALQCWKALKCDTGPQCFRADSGPACFTPSKRRCTRPGRPDCFQPQQPRCYAPAASPSAGVSWGLSDDAFIVHSHGEAPYPDPVGEAGYGLHRAGNAVRPWMAGLWAGNVTVDDPFVWVGADGVFHMLAAQVSPDDPAAAGRHAWSADGVGWTLGPGGAYGAEVEGRNLTLSRRRRPVIARGVLRASADVEGRGQGGGNGDGGAGGAYVQPLFHPRGWR
eukprot:gene35029-16844_t